MEIWSFNYCKHANLAKAKAAPAQAGDVWTWTAIDADSKLLVLHATWYTFARVNSAVRMSPAMAAGLTEVVAAAA